jgi:predicted O-methyltransferase YrrM
LLQNIFTSPTSHLTCVDSFIGNPENIIQKHHAEVQSIFESNIRAINATERVDLKIMKSDDALKYLHKLHFDFIYLDGSHITSDVLTDLVLAWPLLNHGGIMIVDDYQYSHVVMDAVPKIAIDAFQKINSKEIIELHKDWQMIWRKI